MFTYMIVLPAGSRVPASAVESRFPKRYNLIPQAAWVVGDDTMATCSAVRDALTSIEPHGTCVVVRTDDYNGYAVSDLWEKLNEWRQA